MLRDFEGRVKVSWGSSLICVGGPRKDRDFEIVHTVLIVEGSKNGSILFVI